jgi:hypothetical protein
MTVAAAQPDQGTKTPHDPSTLHAAPPTGDNALERLEQTLGDELAHRLVDSLAGDHPMRSRLPAGRRGRSSP